MVRRGRLELPWPIGHYDLNVARLPVPPPPLSGAFMKIGGIGQGPTTLVSIPLIIEVP